MLLFNNKAVGNLEATLFGKNFQMKLFPEVVICLLIALTASGMVHRICTTVWLVALFILFVSEFKYNVYIYIFSLILSLVHLYHINLVSQKTYNQQYTQATNVQTFSNKKRK